jgi:hypothetical protein
MPPSRRSEAVESLVAAFVDQITDAVGRQIDARAREIADDWLRSVVRQRPADRVVAAAARSRLPQPAAEPPEAPVARALPPALATAARARPTVRVRATVQVREKPPAPPPDPEQERRDAELARLRSILKPAHEDVAPAAAASPAPPPLPPAPVVRAESPTDALKQLEDQIRAQVEALADLSAARCTARIAAWAGRVRALESAAPVGRTRVAAQLMLEKLRGLARAMEAGPIDALHPSWRTSNWQSYIAINEATADAPDRRPPAPPEPAPASDAGEGYGDVW